ncbi:MAG: methyltransferase domain-containing protein [Gammaproteobacteria bacterium]|nr:methyltransferase domain-containing protein [Gammaproteobacteria bacterium]
MPDYPAEFFRRVDESPDLDFYREPRFVTHIDTATIDALTAFYADFIAPGADVLDLMSSWISHLPTDIAYGRVVGVGMNEAELARNPQLSEYRIHDLNVAPELPFDTDSFDRATIAVSIQYLIQPVEALSDVHRVLRRQGKLCIAMSHRLFPTKAIMAFQTLDAGDRVRVVSAYLAQAGFTDIEFIDRSPAHADPLWLVVGTSGK